MISKTKESRDPAAVLVSNTSLVSRERKQHWLNTAEPSVVHQCFGVAMVARLEQDCLSAKHLLKVQPVH